MTYIFVVILKALLFLLTIRLTFYILKINSIVINNLNENEENNINFLLISILFVLAIIFNYKIFNFTIVIN